MQEIYLGYLKEVLKARECVGSTNRDFERGQIEFVLRSPLLLEKNTKTWVFSKFQPPDHIKAAKDLLDSAFSSSRKEVPAKVRQGWW